MKYENRKNGRIATVIREDTKYAAMELQYDDDGKMQRIAMSTLKRWWKKVEETEQESVKEPVQEQETEIAKDEVETVIDKETNLTDNDYKEIGKEIVEQAKEKSVKVKKEREPKKENPYIQEILSYIYQRSEKLGGVVWTPSKDIKMRTIKVDNHNCIKINYSNKSVNVAVRNCVISNLNIQPHNTVNHMFGSVFVVTELNSDTKELINNLIKVSVDYQIQKNTSRKN
jgi:hypothetical protein